MTKNEFKTKKFSANTEILLEGSWYKILSVYFDWCYVEIETTASVYGEAENIIDTIPYYDIDDVREVGMMIHKQISCQDIDTGKMIETSAAWEMFRFWVLPWVTVGEFFNQILAGKDEEDGKR